MRSSSLIRLLAVIVAFGRIDDCIKDALASRVPSPIVTKKLKETSETEERGESEEETDVEIETTSETKGTKQEQEEYTEEDPLLLFFRKKRRIRTKLMKRKRSE
ncbi:hypothetical chloroplast RF1 [Fagus crenata]